MDGLVNLVFIVLAIGLMRSLDAVPEAQKVGDEARDDRNCITISGVSGVREHTRTGIV